MSKSKMYRYFQFLLVIIASGAIYPLIYLKGQYQETILAVYNISLEQLNAIFTFLGIACIIGYFPSGLLCDKFSAKKLLALSLLGTAAGGIWFAQVPTYSNVVIIFVIWGFFSVFTFWSAHLKIVQLLAEKNEQGRFQGILDAGKGLVEAVLASLAVFIFSRKIPANAADPASLREPLLAVVWMYIIVLILAAVLVIIFVKEVKPIGETDAVETIKKEEGFNFSSLGSIFKNKYVYIHGIILFAGYVLFWTNYYYSGHLQTNIGLSATTVGKIMVGVLWMRPIGGFIGGICADKFGKSKTNGLALLIASMGLLVLVFAPKTLSIAVYSALIIFIGLILYVIRGTYWSLLGEANISPVILGTAIGVISIIGYLPDIILPGINTFFNNTLGSEAGTEAYFLMSMAIGIVGFAFTFIYRKAQRSDAKKLEENNK